MRFPEIKNFFSTAKDIISIVKRKPTDFRKKYLPDLYLTDRLCLEYKRTKKKKLNSKTTTQFKNGTHNKKVLQR